MNEKNVGAVADNIVIFFRAKAGSRNSFISTTPIYLCRIKRKALRWGNGQERGKQDDRIKTRGRNGQRKRCAA